MVSALTILGQTENEAMYGGSYATLADIIRKRFTDPDATRRELLARIRFNVLVSDSDRLDRGVQSCASHRGGTRRVLEATVSQRLRALRLMTEP
jgi:hypothetical protein